MPFRLDRAVEQTLQMFKGELSASGIDLRMIFDTSAVPLDVTIHGDSARMTQIMVNLLTNAIKFTRTEDTRKIVVRYGSSNMPPEETLFGDTFRWQPTNKPRSGPADSLLNTSETTVYPYFAVSDSGKGIAGDSAERVFRKFEQADQKTHVNYGGSGLGLYISRELAEIQGGSIGIESAATVGSTFAFYTRATRSTDKPIGNGSPLRSRDSIETSRRDSTAGMRVLLVEDNLLNQRVLAKLLRKAGHQVFVANHGGEAIDFVLQTQGRPKEYSSHALKDAPEQFDCVLMDWEMPVCNGLESTRRIREIEKVYGDAANVVIGITANARDDQISTALLAGMDSVLTKPFRVDDLLARIQDVIKSRCQPTSLGSERV